MTTPPPLPSGIDLPVVKKVMIYVFGRGGTVLTFTQAESPTAGRQVPAGTVEQGENVVDAARRELAEESGFRNGFPLIHFADSYEDMSAFKPEIHWRSWFFTSSEGFPTESWTHVEPHISGVDITADFEWLHTDTASETLIAGHGAQLHLALRLSNVWR